MLKGIFIGGILGTLISVVVISSLLVFKKEDVFFEDKNCKIVQKDKRIKVVLLHGDFNYPDTRDSIILYSIKKTKP
jgi:hypothetical protein